MKSHFRHVLVIALCVLAAASPTTASAAEIGQHVQGQFTVAIDPQSVTVQPVGSTCRIGLTATFTFTGDLTGAFVAPFSILHMGACDQPATEVFRALGTWTGSVLGVPGSFEFLFAGTIDPAGHARGELVVLSGAGGLATLRGAIRLDGQAGVGGSYDGAVVLRPS
jgi:hypothetical protein